jgi:hypothetical protein
LSVTIFDNKLSLQNFQNRKKRLPNMSEAATPDVPAAEQPPSISAAAHAYQIAMNQQSTTPTSTASPTAQIADTPRDVVMSDNTPDRPAVSIPHWSSLYGN